MRLQQIKLAGFKSFVDTTVIPFPGQLVGVLGPNGCGKSNVIDAVRWVLGESSAKNLRGESMADVIFNGSTHRRAVGQASVELVFDNTAGTLPGPFGAYREIAVRRVVTRDGESGYFLNGTRCRRRDITDLFLGTGAGARGYSIIGQGTVSKIVEARPEELRAYLEEAAGVSRYRDRRRETVQRMEHARENLERVVLLREELARQLARLERQAKTAERFRTLKTRERVCKIALLLARRESLLTQRDQLQQTLKTLEDTRNTHEATHARLTAEALACRDTMESKARIVADLQEQCYRFGTEIARLEEQRTQALRAREQLLQEQQRLRDVWQQAHDRHAEARESLAASEAQSQVLEGLRETLQADLERAKSALATRRQELDALQTRFESARASLMEARQHQQVNLVRAENLKARLEEGERRLAKNQVALDGLTDSDNEEGLTPLRAALEARMQEAAEASARQTEAGARVQEARETLKRLGHEQADAQKVFAGENAELASLRAIQKAAAGAMEGASAEGFAHLPQLMQSLRVEAGWQKACELVFAHALHAFLVDDVSRMDFDGEAPLALAQVRMPQDAVSRFPSLLQKMQGDIPHWLHAPEHIYTVDSLEAARRLQPQLLAHESVLTPEGAWCGPGWVRIPGKARADEEGVLARQARIESLALSVEEKQAALTLLVAEDATWRERLQAAEQEERAATAATSAAVAAHFGARDALARAEQQVAAHAGERTRLLAERAEWCTQSEALTEQMKEATQAGLDAREVEAEYALVVESLEEERRLVEGAHREAQHAMDTLRDQGHETGRQLDGRQAQAAEARRGMERETQSMESLEARLEDIAVALASADAPDTDVHQSLQEKIAQHGEYEVLRETANTELDGLREQFTQLEREGRLEGEQIKKASAAFVEHQLQEQALLVRLQGLAESLAEFGPQAEAVLPGEEVPCTEAECEQELLVLADAIRRLGTINLAAIEEYEAERARKESLDAQHEDLASALATLEEAIAKLDAETKVRFQETFDAVNTAFQALFPRLFGGGRATLSLTCDNLLEAGVMVLAQPPGKRNSTIHLLSGGEKAMTAVALIFAIFQLNPSPFCMLDEVDAPLDDVNVGRFCDLVREMSQFVQFLFITHNRVTMELAEHLIGVTMREPGVSRVVAVDVEQALTLCEG